MTYLERIDLIKTAQAEVLKLILSDETADALARAADAACLKAIREPTEEMRDELYGGICSAFDANGGVRIGASVKVWHAAHAAIPR